MDDKIVCPHCGHEYTSETIQEIKDFNKSNKFLCFLGCGKEFRVNSNNLDGYKTAKLNQLNKTFIKNNKIIYLLIMCMVATLLYSVFSNASQQKYSHTAYYSNDGEEVLDAVKNIKYDGGGLYYLKERCWKKALAAPADTKERDNWVLAKLECINKEQAYEQSSFRLPAAGTVFIFLLFVTSSIVFYRIYKKYGIRFIGIFLIAIGVIGLIYSLSMNVTVGGVYNIGLLQNRQMMVVIFSTILIAGVITQLAIYIVRNKK